MDRIDRLNEVEWSEEAVLGLAAGTLDEAGYAAFLRDNLS